MANISLNASYFGLTSSGASTLFGSLGGTSSTSTSSSILSDYASIKNGSYGKLLKAYYAKTSESNETSTNSTTNATLVSERDAAKELKASAAKLAESGKDSLFVKKDVKDEEGNVTQEYDMDAIYSAVSDFVEDYNSVIDAAGNSSVNSVLNSAGNMASLTGVMAKSLSKVGITVGLNNKLTIDEEAFKKADMSYVKTLFNGTSSYAYSVSRSASSMVNSVSSQLAQLNGSFYTDTGAYGSSYSYSGSLYTSIF